MKKNNSNKMYHISILIMFFIFLIVGTLASIFHRQADYSETENRYLTKRPEFSWNTLLDGDFTNQYENYLSDQFPLRNQWIGLKILCDRTTLKQDSNGVYFAKDNYYIEKQNTSKFTSTQASTNIQSLKTFIEKQEKLLGNEHLRVAIIPTAAEILKDKLPPFASPYNQGILLKQLEASFPSPIFINMENVLKKHSKESIFYHTDHHWTSLGAYYCYSQWIQSLDLSPYPPDFFTKQVITKDFLGTMHSKLNIPMPADSITLYKPRADFHYKLNYVIEKKESDSLYDMTALKEKDKYKIFLGGNHARIDITTSIKDTAYAPLKNSHLLIIKDSYSHSFAPFAVNHFEKTTLLDLRYFIGSVEDYIKENNVTDILVLYSTSNFVSDGNIKKMLQ